MKALKEACEHGRWEMHHLGGQIEDELNYCPGGQLVSAAARLVERLLPGDVWPCEHGFIYSHVLNPEAVGNPDLTPVVCVGRQVWDEGIVEAVAVSIWNGMGFASEIKPVEGSPCFDAARAVLSAIAELLTEKAGSQ